MSTQAANEARPITPFFLFTEQERKKDSSVTSKDLGEKWKKLPESQKKKYIKEYKDAKEKYEKLLTEVYGVDPMSFKSSSKPNEFSITRVRAALGLKSMIKPMAKELYPGLVKVLVILEPKNIFAIRKPSWRI